MTRFKTTCIAAALMVSASVLPATAFAQDGMKDKAKDMAVDMAKDKAKDEAKDMMGDKMGATGHMATDKAIDMGADMAKGKSMKDAATGAVMGGAKSEAKSMMQGDTMLTEKGKMDGDDMMTAGKVMMKGGTAEDAAMAVAKENAKDAMTHNAKKMMKKGMGQHEGTVKSAPMMDGKEGGNGMTMSEPMAAPAPSLPPINCPAGTTAQPNGTCMITGDYQPRS